MNYDSASAALPAVALISRMITSFIMRDGGGKEKDGQK
jgi:hypothetical protein